VTDDEVLLLKLSEDSFATVADQYSGIWRRLAQELARRLTQRNALIRPPNEKPRVFVISSAEALPVARAIESLLAHDPLFTVVWANGVFRVTNYTLESLEVELDRCDFAVAVAHPDDTTTSRDDDWPSPRDNVVFELGFFMGRLGRDRAILMEPRGQRLKLPSDLAGITTIKYRTDHSESLQQLLGPACTELREHILALGRNL
jgi:predicted nucleotide-binding protein